MIEIKNNEEFNVVIARAGEPILMLPPGGSLTLALRDGQAIGVGKGDPVEPGAVHAVVLDGGGA